MRLPVLARDSWEIVVPDQTSGSAELRRARQNLSPGHGVKVMMRLATADLGTPAGGRPPVIIELPWLLVTEQVGDLYLGVLLDHPRSQGRHSAPYVGKGAEIPFTAGAVIATSLPATPAEGAMALRQNPVVRRWPRDEAPTTNLAELIRVAEERLIAHMNAGQTVRAVGARLMPWGTIEVADSDQVTDETAFFQVLATLRQVTDGLAYAIAALALANPPIALLSVHGWVHLEADPVIAARSCRQGDDGVWSIVDL